MGAFLKTCSIGFLVIVLSPLWAALFLIYVLIGSLMLILSPLKMLYCIFTHKKFTIKTYYDFKAEKILNGNVTKETSFNSQYTSQVQQPSPFESVTNTSFVQQTQQYQPPTYPNNQFDPRVNNNYQNGPYQQSPYQNSYNNQNYNNNNYLNQNPFNNYPNINYPNNQCQNNNYPNRQNSNLYQNQNYDSQNKGYPSEENDGGEQR